MDSSCTDQQMAAVTMGRHCPPLLGKKGLVQQNPRLYAFCDDTGTA